MAMKGYTLKLQHYWSLTIRLFNVISRTHVRGVSPVCWDAVVLFYSLPPSRLGHRTLIGGSVTSLQRCSRCILQTPSQLGKGLFWVYFLILTVLWSKRSSSSYWSPISTVFFRLATNNITIMSHRFSALWQDPSICLFHSVTHQSTSFPTHLVKSRFGFLARAGWSVFISMSQGILSVSLSTTYSDWYTYLFTHPFWTSRMWHKVNFLAEFNKFQFIVFLLDQLKYQG